MIYTNKTIHHFTHSFVYTIYCIQIIDLAPASSSTSASNSDANTVNATSNVPAGKRELVFVSGNLNKYKELVSYFQDAKFKDFNIIQRDIDLQEIQHDSQLRIVEEKCKSAHLLLDPSSSDSKHSILIEDTCMGFDEWNGLPGPYIKCE